MLIRLVIRYRIIEVGLYSINHVLLGIDSSFVLSMISDHIRLFMFVCNAALYRAVEVGACRQLVVA